MYLNKIEYEYKKYYLKGKYDFENCTASSKC